MIRIEPLGTGIFLPAFVVGYELLAGEEDSRLDSISPDGTPLLVLDQQAGGYCMSYPSVAGAVLRVEANDGNGTRAFADLVRGFKAMAEDPDLALLEAEFPSLRRLVYTTGGPYGRTDLQRAQGFLRRFVNVPGVEGGIEAFLRFGRCDVLDYFGGWNVLSCRLTEPHRRRGSLPTEAPACYRVEQGNVSDLSCDDGDVLDEKLLGRVRELGRALGRDDDPRVFFLWENSD